MLGAQKLSAEKVIVSLKQQDITRLLSAMLGLLVQQSAATQLLRTDLENSRISAVHRERLESNYRHFAIWYWD
eukprot:12430584-Karenia_brevis.AAC.1